MKTLNEMAQDLQDYIVSAQQDAHNSVGANQYKYNNLKLTIDTKIPFQNLVVRIGISEATYNLKENVKADGSLGPDERYVRKWLDLYYVLPELKKLNQRVQNLLKLQDEIRSITIVGQAGERKKEAPNQKPKFKQLLDEARQAQKQKTIKKNDLKDYLKKNMKKKD